MFRWIDVLVPVEFPSSENLIPVRWIALPTHGLFLAKIDHAALWWHGGYSKFVFLGQGKWMNVMINQGIWVFWGNFPWFSDKAMWLMRCRTAASQVNRSRFAQWKERRRSSSKSEWVSSNWPWSRTQQLCHAMLLDALISTPPTPICSSSQGNGSERASTDPDWDFGIHEWWMMVDVCQMREVMGTLNTTRWYQLVGHGKKFTDTTSEKLRNRQKCIDPIYVITISSSVHVHLSRVVSLVFLQLVVSRIVSLSANELKFFSQRYMCRCFAETGQKPPIRTVTDHTPIVSNYDLSIIQPYRYIPIHNTYSHNPRKWDFSPHHNITQSHSVTVPLSWRIFRRGSATEKSAMTMVSNHQWLSTVKAGRFSKWDYNPPFTSIYWILV